MNLSKTEHQLLDILRAYLNNGDPVSAADTDWKQVFLAADKQHLLPVVYDAVRRTGITENNAELFRQVKKLCIESAARQIIMQTDSGVLIGQMRAAGLHPVLVKGRLISGLYPEPYLRQSVDIDLLVRDDEFTACHEILISAGMETECSGEQLRTRYEVGYRSHDGIMFIELHRNLFDDEEEELNRPFKEVFEKDQTAEIDGILTLNPHMHLLFLIFHAYKHFIFSGTGIRNVCDIGLWMSAYGSEIDGQLLYRQCREAHAETFASALFRIADDALGFSVCSAAFRSDIDPEPMLTDMLEGGIYGTSNPARAHTSTVTLNTVRADRSGKRKPGFLRSAFPAFSYMKRHYPYLEKYPFLLPAAWVQRIFRYLKETGKTENNRTEDTVRIAKKRIELLRYYNMIDQ